jgi:exopolyphosphatase/guanosine-5'-triphosphate,3'-diphosphate pyrophosphatase
MPSRPLAALDLGSNTFRLILAQAGDFGQGPLNRRVFQEIPRVAEGITPGQAFAAEPLARGFQALEFFQEQIKLAAPSRVLAGATMAFREAANGSEVIKKIHQLYGWETHLLSGSEEARLSALGVLSGLDPLPPSGLIVDIGGRSTEFIVTKGQTIASFQSLSLGVVGLTSQYVVNDPPRASELEALALASRTALAKLSPEILAVGPKATLVGTAGTVTTIGAMLLGLSDYDGDLVNNQVIAKEAINQLLARLAREKLTTRQKTPGLHPRRADVILAGLVLVLTILDFFGQSALTVSDNSLLEGLWLAAAGRVRLKEE